MKVKKAHNLGGQHSGQLGLGSLGTSGMQHGVQILVFPVELGLYPLTPETCCWGAGSTNFLVPAFCTQVSGLWPEKAWTEWQVLGARSCPGGARERWVLNGYGGTNSTCYFCKRLFHEYWIHKVRALQLGRGLFAGLK